MTKPGEKPFLPLLCRVMAGLNDEAFQLHCQRMMSEKMRRGHLSESCSPDLPVGDIVLAGLDNLGWVVLLSATEREIARRTEEREMLAQVAKERMGESAKALIEEVPLPDAGGG